MFVLFGPEGAPEASGIDAIAKGRAMVFGAAATADIQLVKDGQVDKGRVAAVRFEGVGVPVVESATACRLISEPMVVTQATRQTLAEESTASRRSTCSRRRPAAAATVGSSWWPCASPNHEGRAPVSHRPRHRPEQAHRRAQR